MSNKTPVQHLVSDSGHGTTPAATKGKQRTTLTIGGIVGAVVLLTVVVVTIFAPLLAPTDPTAIDPVHKLLGPGEKSGSVLGTDLLGRDVASRVMWGGRTALTISLIGSTLGLALGLLFAVASAVNDRVDFLIARLGEIQLAVPTLILAMCITAFLGFGTVQLVIVVTLGSWVINYRVARSVLKSVAASDYVIASRAAGLSTVDVARLHFLPAVLPQAILTYSMALNAGILLVAGLGFIGLGVQPPDADWGQMVADGQGQLSNAWWISVFPGLALVLTTVAVQLTADWLSKLSGARHD
jgi:peptide/nickel transport system permease protein